MMEQQPQLPYQPIVFIKTGVIGGNQPNHDISSKSYDFTHRHILQPHYLSNHQAIFYVLFHTPSIYNWLRTVPCRESELLNNYISNPKIFNLINIAIDPEQLLNSLEDYSSKWEVAKLTFASRVYINKVREFGGTACPHLSKTQQKAIILNYDKAQEKVTCSRVKCKQCRRDIEVQSQIRQLSECFLSKFGTSRLSPNGVIYQASIVLCKWKVFVLAANKIWYCVDLKTGQNRSIGIQNVQFRESLFVVYRKQEENQPAIIRAQPLNKELFISAKAETNRFKQSKQEKEDTQKQPEQVMQNASSLKKAGSSITQAIFQPNNKVQKIRPLKYEPNKVILPSTESSNSYVKQVSRQFLAVKAKDAYELDYDRGKLKKKKEKRQYVQPDFNEVFAMVKSKKQQGVSEQTRKIKKNEKRAKRREINFGPDSD